MNQLPDSPARSQVLSKLLFSLFALFCLSPWGSPPYALLLGIVLALTAGNPFPATGKKLTALLLQVSVVGLGFGVQAEKALQAGQTGLLLTVGSIAATLLLGVYLGKRLNVETRLSYLISCGTAICGGSAIAAIAPVIRAEKGPVTVALGTVFILNSLALFIFPSIGEALNLRPDEFGLWAAIAIHDTSSVVATAARFGEESLQYATTIKLVRALWIIPLVMVSAYVYKSKSGGFKIPYFIGFFVLAIVISSYVPALSEISADVVTIARKGLTLTLLLIGSGLTRETIREVGLRPFVQGCVLWICVSVASLAFVLSAR